MDDTKTVLVTVALKVHKDADIDEVVSDMGYQFVLYDEELGDLILDTEIINAVELN